MWEALYKKYPTEPVYDVLATVDPHGQSKKFSEFAAIFISDRYEIPLISGTFNAAIEKCCKCFDDNPLTKISRTYTKLIAGDHFKQFGIQPPKFTVDSEYLIAFEIGFLLAFARKLRKQPIRSVEDFLSEHEDFKSLGEVEQFKLFKLKIFSRIAERVFENKSLTHFLKILIPLCEIAVHSPGGGEKVEYKRFSPGGGEKVEYKRQREIIRDIIEGEISPSTKNITSKVRCIFGSNGAVSVDDTAIGAKDASPQQTPPLSPQQIFDFLKAFIAKKRRRHRQDDHVTDMKSCDGEISSPCEQNRFMDDWVREWVESAQNVLHTAEDQTMVSCQMHAGTEVEASISSIICSSDCRTSDSTESETSNQGMLGVDRDAWQQSNYLNSKRSASIMGAVPYACSHTSGRFSSCLDSDETFVDTDDEGLFQFEERSDNGEWSEKPASTVSTAALHFRPQDSDSDTAEPLSIEEGISDEENEEEKKEDRVCGKKRRTNSDLEFDKKSKEFGMGISSPSEPPLSPFNLSYNGSDSDSDSSKCSSSNKRRRTYTMNFSAGH